MRWNCPHCGVRLSVADDQLTSGWSFSRCSKCTGYSLVRKAEVNLIKVDRAPRGEKIVLPEEENALLGEQIVNRLNQYPAHYNKGLREPPNPGLSQPMELPLPNNRFRILPAAIGISGVVAVASGIYLTLEGLTIWRKVSIPQISNVETKNQEKTDEIVRQSMSPMRSGSSSFMVQPKVDRTPLLAGPGEDYSSIGNLEAAQKYLVLDWKDQWFKIRNSHLTGWVKNESVRTVSSSD